MLRFPPNLSQATPDLPKFFRICLIQGWHSYRKDSAESMDVLSPHFTENLELIRLGLWSYLWMFIKYLQIWRPQKWHEVMLWGILYCENLYCSVYSFWNWTRFDKVGMKNWPTAATCHFSTPDGIFWEKQHAPADLPNPPLGWVSVLLLKGQSKCLVHPQWRCRKLT